MKESDLYKRYIQKTTENLQEFGSMLSKNSVPFWSPRYMGHMNMDTTLPSIIGYVTTMLFNPNNVAVEASPFTTLEEQNVGRDLSKMLGYNTKLTQEPVAWGHITCDGSVANLESVWYTHQCYSFFNEKSRNLKFYPLSLHLAIRPSAPLNHIAEKFHIELCNGKQKLFKDCNTWEILNLKTRTILDLPERLYKEHYISKEYLESVMYNYTIQTVGKDFLEKQFEISKPILYFVGITKHYSWPKSAAVTGIGSGEIGSENFKNIPVDDEARIDPVELDKLLNECLNKQQAVYAVVAIIGSTEHGAVDPLDKVVKLRKKYEEKGLTFVIHADAAWGGYFASMLHPSELPKLPDRDFVPELALKEHTMKQLRCLKDRDSITVDPHKSGYCPYPAGGLCYKDSRMRYLITWKSPIVFRSDEGIESIGVYGIEGSKPGAAPAGVSLSHKVIELNRGGHGILLGEATFSCTK
ncbi:5966_t:CDS:2, partial [Racocetra persica]